MCLHIKNIAIMHDIIPRGKMLFWCQSFGDVSLCLFIILLVQFGLLSGHLLGNSCPLG